MAVLDLLQKRYAVKSFNGEKIPEEDISKMKEAIRLTPSSFNWQPWKVKIVEDKETLEKLQVAAFNQPQIGTASHLFVFCSISDLKENNEKLLNKMKVFMDGEKFEVFKGITTGAVSRMDSESQKRMSEREVFAAMENLVLMATDLGYGSCPMGGFDAEKFKDILDLSEGVQPVVIVPVGISADKPRDKFRFSDEDIFF